jgi:selenocysteine lyase/cysteine desulfurase
MEKYFNQFRKNIIGIDQKYTSPYGTMNIIYADWIASGRLYRPIEDQMTNVIGPFVANTHTETSETGTLMTKAYHLAHQKIKDHVNASADDLIVTSGFGMTSCINKLQRIIGLKFCGTISKKECLKTAEKTVVFVNHL